MLFVVGLFVFLALFWLFYVYVSNRPRFLNFSSLTIVIHLLIILFF